jgi:ABC-type uncharacterized transport system permease subunit
MLSGVQIVCFASSYAIALALELSRLFFRSAIRGMLLLIFAGVGLVLHTAFLYYRAMHTAGIPLSSNQDWYLLAAWVVVVIYLYLLCFRPRTPSGLLLLPLVLGLIGTASLLAPHPFTREPASKVWGVIHGVSLLLATVSVLLGFAAGATYLGQVWRLKHNRPALRGLRLPSLEWLQKANRHAILVAALMFGVGIISGVILNAIRGAGPAGRLPVSDPVVASAIAVFVWLLAALVLGHLHRGARHGRRVAYLTVASFVVLVIALAVGLLLNTQHGGRSEGGGRKVEGGRQMVEGGGLANGAALGIQYSPFPLLPSPLLLPPSDFRISPPASRLPPSAFPLPPSSFGGVSP